MGHQYYTIFNIGICPYYELYELFRIIRYYQQSVTEEALSMKIPDILLLSPNKVWQTYPEVRL